jgi:hypothetical protein
MYGDAVIEALRTVWAVLDYSRGKRLAAALAATVSHRVRFPAEPAIRAKWDCPDSRLSLYPLELLLGERGKGPPGGPKTGDTRDGQGPTGDSPKGSLGGNEEEGG